MLPASPDPQSPQQLASPDLPLSIPEEHHDLVMRSLCLGSRAPSPSSYFKDAGLLSVLQPSFLSSLSMSPFLYPSSLVTYSLQLCCFLKSTNPPPSSTFSFHTFDSFMYSPFSFSFNIFSLFWAVPLTTRASHVPLSPLPSLKAYR